MTKKKCNPIVLIVGQTRNIERRKIQETDNNEEMVREKAERQKDREDE